MHDGDDHDDVDDFRQAVQHNVLLLKGAPNEAMRRKAATSILECIKHGVLSENNNTSKLNSVREAFSMLLAELGPGDEQILESILGLLLASAVKADMRQLLLDLLPAVVITVADTEAVFETVKAVQEKDTTALLPILCSLSQLPLADEERKQVFLLAVGALSTVSEQELPSLVRAILRHVSCTSEAVSAWIALRYEWQLKEQQHHDNDSDVDWSQRVAHIVVASFAESNGEILAASFVKLLEELKLDTADNCHEGDDCILVLDLIVLLTLSVQLQYTDTANRIVDSWLRRHVFPFTLLDAVLRQMLPTQHQNQLNQRLTQALLRLSVFLLLAPARATSVSLSIESLVHAFVLNLQHRLDCERQAELVHSLLHLSEETAVSWRGTNSATTTGRRKRKLPAVNELNALTIVHQSVNTLLQRFAETAPNTLIRFKHILTGRLTSTTYSCDSQSICSILTSLMQSDCLEISELMVLLQKLLFSGSVRGDSSRVVRGIMLATELIRCCADRECIQEWVLRLLLPATRRTVDPELGSPGLAFLKALRKLEKNDSKNDIFQHFKLILANTGLIQMLANYQMSKDDDAILGYSKLPFYFQSTAVKSRSMLFCVNFFLRHMDTADARRWPYVTQWVFELVDTYLCMGREKANKWRPDGWLLASVEFPTIFLPFDESVVNQKAVVDWMKRILCHFELTEEIQGKCAGLTDYAETIVHNLEIRQLRQFLESVYRFSLSLLVGVVLSAAVLKNAFEHLRAVQIGENAYKSANAGDLLRLVKLQVIKIYDLRTKSKVIEALLFALESSIRRSLFRKKRAAVGVSDDLSDISIEEVVDTEHSIEVRVSIAFLTKDLASFCISQLPRASA